MEEKKQTIYTLKTEILKEIADKFKNQIPIRRGCNSAVNGGCFCTGKCQEIIGWRKKVIGEDNWTNILK